MLNCAAQVPVVGGGGVLGVVGGNGVVERMTDVVGTKGVVRRTVGDITRNNNNTLPFL